ncbi:hypothetical protein I6F35_28275 [Bradyrhizobium sp. BRP22]|uniref:hypothetical protein n=1 Tax=Bradyrhizobium sp. BRP22 TaxID=2793821 RepID=UPI001CD6DA9B|nr:hypothetical protein [Bradyrhizobium sp. BRP22]MCA1457068.1 hypothetical protein [Bradyrhizobium sp. BRP22]
MPYVLDVDEFRPIVESARRIPECTISDPVNGYHKIVSPREIILRRRDMKMKPAVWYGLFTGGLNGEIAEFNRGKVPVIGAKRPL